MDDVKTVPDDIKCVEDNKNGERTFKDVEQTPTAVDVETVRPSAPEVKVDDPTEPGQEPATLTIGKEDSTTQNAEAKNDAKMGINEQTQNGVGSSTGQANGPVDITQETCTTSSADEFLVETCTAASVVEKPAGDDKLNGAGNTTQETCTTSSAGEFYTGTCISVSEDQKPKEIEPDAVQNSNAEETVKVSSHDECVAPPPTMWGASLFGGCCHASTHV